jgi:hypothetical protein
VTDDRSELAKLLFPGPKDHCRGRGVNVGVDHRGCLGFYGGSHCNCECHDNPALLVDNTLRMPAVPTKEER